VKLRLKYQRFGLKAPGAELLRQRQGGFCVSTRPFEIHQSVPAEECRVVANHFRPAMSNSRRSVDRGVSDRERASRVAGKPLGEGHHRPVRHFDAAEAVPFTEFYAQAEPVVCADHPSANVLGVAETAEGHGFKLDRAGTPR
jgi:hypothetical protein